MPDAQSPTSSTLTEDDLRSNSNFVDPRSLAKPEPETVLDWGDLFSWESQFSKGAVRMRGVRLPNGEVMIDIRECITDRQGSRFTLRGMRLRPHQADTLVQKLPSMIEAIRSLMGRKVT